MYFVYKEMWKLMGQKPHSLRLGLVLVALEVTPRGVGARMLARVLSILVATVWPSARCLFPSRRWELRRAATGLLRLPTPSSVPGTLPSTQKRTGNEPLNGRKTGMDEREEGKERRERGREGGREGERIASLRSLVPPVTLTTR